MAAFATLGGLISDKPSVPNLPTIDPIEEQRKAIAGNLANFESIKTLGSKTQEALSQQIRAGIETMFPGTTGLIDASIDSIMSGIRGELPKDVENFIARKAAEQAVSTGTTGSQFASFRELRNLGLTSLARSQQSIDAALRWVTSAFQTTPTVDISQMFITPQFATQVAISERDTRFNQQWLKSQVNAMTSDKSIIGQGLIQFDRDLMAIGTSLLGSFSGGGGGGASTPNVSTTNFGTNIQ